VYYCTHSRFLGQSSCRLKHRVAEHPIDAVWFTVVLPWLNSPLCFLLSFHFVFISIVMLIFYCFFNYFLINNFLILSFNTWYDWLLYQIWLSFFLLLFIFYIIFLVNLFFLISFLFFMLNSVFFERFSFLHFQPSIFFLKIKLYNFFYSMIPVSWPKSRV
jgi:hypothetical protein